MLCVPFVVVVVCCWSVTFLLVLFVGACECVLCGVGTCYHFVVLCRSSLVCSFVVGCSSSFVFLFVSVCPCLLFVGVLLVVLCSLHVVRRFLKVYVCCVLLFLRVVIVLCGLLCVDR